MKKRKMFLSALIPVTLFGMASCTNSNPSSNSSATPTTSSTAEVIDDSTSNDAASFMLTAEGKHRLSAEPTTDAASEIIDSLISKGGELIAGGIQTYGKMVVINLLKECGYDFRDATTKTLEKIQEQLGVVQEKITALAAQESQHHSELILNPVLDIVKDAAHYSSNFVVNGLGYLADRENDSSLTEEVLENERKQYYKDAVEKLFINGKPFADYVTNFAEKILTPNNSDMAKDIFYYYDETLGVYDVWSSFKTRNMQNFMAYIDSTLVSCANLAKFQMYYYTQGMGTAAMKSYENMINDMAAAVNKVNAKFKSTLDSLKPIEEKYEKGIVTYLKTGKEYSRRMATLTYDINDKVGENDSRQALIRDFYQCSDGSRGDMQHEALQYVPDTSFVASVANDFRTYSQAFYTPDYTIIDYLKFAGFYANNEDLFDKSLGLYNANMYVDSHGWYYEDYDYCGTYYDVHGNYNRKINFKVCSYHNWLGYVTRTTLENCDAGNYYLCFATPDGEKQKLDGNYTTIYMKDTRYTVQKAAFYNEYYYNVNRTNQNGWFLHDCW